MAATATVPAVTRVLGIDVGTTNLAVCVLEATTDGSSLPFRIVPGSWELIDLNRSTVPVASAVALEFLRRPWLYAGVSDVAIESQSQSRPPIQAVAAAIRAHFETTAMLCGSGARVHWVNGTTKLKVVTREVAVSNRCKPGSYIYRNRLAEAHAASLLEDLGDADHAASYAAAPKKDDLADETNFLLSALEEL